MRPTVPRAGVIMGTNLFWAHTLTPGTWLGWAAHALVWPMTKSVPQVRQARLVHARRPGGVHGPDGGCRGPQGTATQVFCLLAPGIEDRSGGFFRHALAVAAVLTGAASCGSQAPRRRNCGQEKKVKPHGRDPATAARLWTLAEKLTGSQFEL